MVAEERISTQFCGLVLAQDDEEEGSFLSTQLVDEVRHMQFYARFQDEVIADPAAIADARRAIPRGPERTLRAHLRRGAGQGSRPAASRPADREAKVDFVTIYHMVLEGTLGIVTSHFLLGLLARARAPARFRRRLRPDRRRRAAPHRLRHLVSARGGQRRLGDGRGGSSNGCLTCCPHVAESLSPPERGRARRARGRGGRARGVRP